MLCIADQVIRWIQYISNGTGAGDDHIESVKRCENMFGSDEAKLKELCLYLLEEFIDYIDLTAWHEQLDPERIEEVIAEAGL